MDLCESCSLLSLECVIVRSSMRSHGGGSPLGVTGEIPSRAPWSTQHSGEGGRVYPWSGSWLARNTRARVESVLRGRRTECAALDRLLEAVRAGQSGALVLRGEAGVGKTALLEYAAERAEGCRVLRAVGRGVRDGAAVRRAAPAVRAAARPARAAAGARSATRSGRRSA